MDMPRRTFVHHRAHLELHGASGRGSLTSVPEGIGTRGAIHARLLPRRRFRVIGSRAHQVTRSLIAVSACGLGVRTISGEPITIPPKSMGTDVRYVAGGMIFGLGWALSGACPGPLFALVGNGVIVMIVPSPARWLERGSTQS